MPITIPLLVSGAKIELIRQGYELVSAEMIYHHLKARGYDLSIDEIEKFLHPKKGEVRYDSK